MGCRQSTNIQYNDYIKEIEIQLKTGDLFFSFETEIHYKTSYNYYNKCMDMSNEIIKNCNDRNTINKVKYVINKCIKPRLEKVEAILYNKL